jgi:hypothetical protein
MNGGMDMDKIANLTDEKTNPFKESKMIKVLVIDINDMVRAGLTNIADYAIDAIDMEEEDNNFSFDYASQFVNRLFLTLRNQDDSIKALRELMKDGSVTMIAPDLVPQMDELVKNKTPFAVQFLHNDEHVTIIDGNDISW